MVAGRWTRWSRGMGPRGLVLAALFAARVEAQPSTDAGTAPPELREVSGALALTVGDLGAALVQLRALVQAKGGELTSETVSSSAQLTVSVAPSEVQRLFDAAAGLGHVETRSVAVVDQRQALMQLERSLDRAGRSAEEGGEGDGSMTKGEWEAQRDELLRRVHRATCVFTVSLPSGEEPLVSHLFVGVRASALAVAGAARVDGAVGVGVVVQPAHWVTFEGEALRSSAALSGREGHDGLLFTAGLHFDSALYGRGARRFFNPSLELRAGLGAAPRRFDVVVGVGAGLELVHLARLSVAVQLRALVLTGNHPGPELGLQSGLTVATAF